MCALCNHNRVGEKFHRIIYNTLCTLGLGKYHNIARCDIVKVISQYRDIRSAIFAILSLKRNVVKYLKMF